MTARWLPGCLALLLSVMLPGTTGAAAPRWEPLPQISGAGACSLAVSPTFSADHTAWAGAVDGGLYKSVDGGAHWSRLRIPAGWLPACPIAISPDFASDHLVVAVTDQAYASTNGGESWQPLSLPGAPAAITFSPAFGRDHTVLAASDSGPVFVSTDAGSTWKQVADWKRLLPAAADFILYGATILPNGSIFLETGNGLYRSTDGGASWAWANNGLPTSQQQDPASAVTYRRVERVSALVALESPADLLASLFAAGRGWLYRSHDDGQHWRRVVGPLPVRPTSLTTSGGQWLLGTHEAGVLASRDQGKTWRPLGKELADADIVAVVVASGKTILAAGAEDGVYQYAGGAWKEDVGGMRQSDPVTSIVSSPTGALAGTLAGVARLTSRGWVPDDSGLPGERSIAGIVRVGTGAHQVLFAATSSGLYRQRASHSWQQVGPAVTRGVVAYGLDSRAVQGRIVVAAATENGLYWSRDGGTTWHTAGAMNVTSVGISPRYQTDRAIYGLCDGRIEVYSPGASRVVRGDIGGSPVLAFAVRPREPARLLAATAFGIYAQAGPGWRRVYSGALGAAPIVRFETSGPILIGGAHDLVISDDGGSRWRSVPTPHHDPVTAISEQIRGAVLVGLAGDGVWQFEHA